MKKYEVLRVSESIFIVPYLDNSYVNTVCCQSVGLYINGKFISNIVGRVLRNYIRTDDGIAAVVYIFGLPQDLSSSCKNLEEFYEKYMQHAYLSVKRDSYGNNILCINSITEPEYALKDDINDIRKELESIRKEIANLDKKLYKLEKKVGSLLN